MSVSSAQAIYINRAPANDQTSKDGCLGGVQVMRLSNYEKVAQTADFSANKGLSASRDGIH